MCKASCFTTSSPFGYYNNGYGQNKKCEPNCMYCDPHCRQCAEGFSLASGKCVSRVDCPVGTYFNGHCEPCPAGCATCNGKCLTCLSGHTLFNGHCLDQRCSGGHCDYCGPA